MGGKYYLTGWLSQYIPEHTAYIEPFCGAGHLLFSKESSQVEVLNDIDGHLIAFFKVIQHPETRQALVDRLDYMPYSRSLWNEIRSQWKAGDIPENEIERVSWWFYLNRTTFSGDQKCGGFAVPSTTGRNPVQSFRNAVDSLKAIAERLRNVCIENLDYQECIRRYDSLQTLFYIDCPYYGHEHYYGDSFSHEDHHRLSELLHGIKGHAMVSHYDNELYSTLYKGWNKYTYQGFKGSHKAETGTEKPVTVECLYTNFEPVKTRGLFDAME
jgi:DNA adenine methylase